MGDSKHLEMIQAVIQRLAGNGFVIKGWGVTLLTAILGATLKESRASFALFGLVPILIFWMLDTYFLCLERGFRAVYKAAAERARQEKAPTFDMTPPALEVGPILEAMFSPAVILVYAPALVVLLGAALSI